MRVALRLELPGQPDRDVILTGDVTMTVREAARALASTGGAAEAATLPPEDGAATLLCAPPEGPERILDPAAPLVRSGLLAGWTVRPLPEFAAAAPRAVPTLGEVTVLDGPQAGARFSLVAGRNTIGRDPRSRVLLTDRSVSRRHAVIDAADTLVLRDLGSANGLELSRPLKSGAEASGAQASGAQVSGAEITGTAEVRLGNVTLRVTPAPSGDRAAALPAALAAAERAGPADTRLTHTRPPRLEPRFAGAAHELPTPPTPQQRSRVPVLALAAPVVLGLALYALTRSPMTLMMVAFSPLMMLGSWLDGRLTGARASRRDTEGFAQSLERVRGELSTLRAEEIRVRGAESPTQEEVSAAIRGRRSLLWSRRPGQTRFLEVRLGTGRVASRSEVVLPPRGAATEAHWQQLRAVASEYARVGPVPVTERLGSCGALGVAGDPRRAAACVRGLLLQLAALHSPAELAIAAFLDSPQERSRAGARPWDWLKWLPHAGSSHGPLPAAPLADSPQDFVALLTALEALAAARGARPERAARGDGAPLPAVVVLVCPTPRPEYLARLIALSEAGPGAGVHLIWLAAEVAALPAACRTFVELPAEHTGPSLGHARMTSVRDNLCVELDDVTAITARTATLLARELAPVVDAAAPAGPAAELPNAVRLSDIHEVELLDGPTPILQRWARSETLVAAWEPGPLRPPMRLAATVGRAREGPVAFDLRADGPHALVGGTTGAGKSEFLQSWIMSLAVNVSPDRLTFLLVDYKGGAAFAECAELPHTVGLITDLTPQLVARALVALRAEVRRREALLAAHGAKDLASMEQRRQKTAPPALVIVVDEFAALAHEVPEFVDGMVDIAQRGRSLGLHLIMATQRPAGVVTDNLRANTNLRVALRMADAADSLDVLGVSDAARFPAEVPGRAAVTVGSGRLDEFQAGYVGGAGDSGRGRDAPRVRAFEVGSRGLREPDTETPARSNLVDADGPRDIERLRDGLRAAAALAELPPPRRPWLPALPEIVTLAELAGHGWVGRGVAIGIADDPANQAQPVAALDFDASGNAALFGASGAGLTTALVTIAAAACTARADPVHVYGIAAGGGLSELEALPQVAGIAGAGDDERAGRVLRVVTELVSRRAAAFAALHVASLNEYRDRLGARAEHTPRVLLLLDGYAAFAEAAERQQLRAGPEQQLLEIMRAGRSVGVHVIITADRPAALPPALRATVQEQYVFRLASELDRGRGAAPAESAPGRAVRSKDGLEVQFACVGEAPGLSAQAAALARLAGELRLRSGAAPEPVRNAPALVTDAELPAATDGRPTRGIATDTLAPFGVPAAGLAVCAGPAGSGVSTALRACASAVARWARANGRGIDRVLLSCGAAGDRELAAAGWDQIARGEAAVTELAETLAGALSGLPPAAAPASASVAAGAAGKLSPESRRGAFAAAGNAGVIVVEQPGVVAQPSTTAALVALARAARRADVLVVFEWELGAGTEQWELLGAVKQPTWGVLLQPGSVAGQTVFREDPGRSARAREHPGRGVVIERGRATPVQVAVPVPAARGGAELSAR